MKRLELFKKYWAVAVFLAMVGFGVANAPKTAQAVQNSGTSVILDDDRLYAIYYASYTGVATSSADIAGLGGGISRSGGNVVGYSWTIYPNGGGGTFTLSQTTRTYTTTVATATYPAGFTSAAPTNLAAPNSTTVASISTGAPVGFINGQVLSGVFEDVAINPVFSFSGLSTTATYYIWVEYGQNKGK